MGLGDGVRGWGCGMGLGNGVRGSGVDVWYYKVEIIYKKLNVSQITIIQKKYRLPSWGCDVLSRDLLLNSPFCP